LLKDQREVLELTLMYLLPQFLFQWLKHLAVEPQL
jgi:hypothetical protein